MYNSANAGSAPRGNRRAGLHVMDYVKSKSHTLTRVAYAVFAALLGVGLLSLAGCGSSQQSDEELVRSSLASELDSIKNLDEKFVN